ncbi:protein tyrosine phosphatase [Sodalis ligni]|uniref:protein-tyrosine-phosphatase n=1 Tax=Sodalis ligni TaxID=2697027 RepID=A0A4R1NMR2_9GAMM|nr:protein tyrosine phosphatase [Sodalis ligni]TCL07331.1 protein-tyrosine phosphatase [Sodalis ligni]
MFSKIIVVCVGNICRSPLGECILQKAFPEKKISSAGIAAMEGLPADDKAIKVADAHNFDIKGHEAKQLTSQMCHDNDLILVMEKKHTLAINQISPESRGKIMLFGHWLNQQDINDPFRKSLENFEHTFNLIETAAQKWVTALKR